MGHWRGPRVYDCLMLARDSGWGTITVTPRRLTILCIAVSYYFEAPVGRLGSRQ